MKESGLLRNRMAKERKYGLMGQYMRVNLRMVLRLVMEYSYGQMVAAIKVISYKTTCMDSELTNEATVDSIRVHGIIIRCTAKGYSNELMDVYMKVITYLIKRKVMVSLSGLMDEYIQDHGRTEYKKEWAMYCFPARSTKRNTESGEMAKGSGGLINLMYIYFSQFSLCPVP